MNGTLRGFFEPLPGDPWRVQARWRAAFLASLRKECGRGIFVDTIQATDGKERDAMPSTSWMSVILGGALIGAASSLLLIADGKIAGISGILGGVLRDGVRREPWRAFFLLDLLVGGVILRALTPDGEDLSRDQAVEEVDLAAVQRDQRADGAAMGVRRHRGASGKDQPQARGLGELLSNP